MTKWGKYFVNLTVYAIFLFLVGTAQASTLEVCKSGCTYSTIQAAINAASAGDTVLVDDGIYTENINFNGKAITVKSVNGTASTIIDGGGPTNPIGIIVPAYFYPSWTTPETNLWDDLADAATKIPIIAIMNPDSGPGNSQNPDYVHEVDALRAAGGKVIGYVHTSYGDRSITSCKAEVDEYYAWYNIDGIFFDEMSTLTEKLDYYDELEDYVDEKGGGGKQPIIVGNPGTNTIEDYNTDGNLVIFEGNSDGYPGWTPSSWTMKYSTSMFCNMIYSVSNQSTMEDYINLASSRNIGWIYITNDTRPNPWDTLPSYWEQEVERIANNSTHSVVTFNHGEDENSVLKGFTITNGSGSLLEFYGNIFHVGGGIIFDSSSPSIINCKITSNSPVELGGGVFCYNSSPSITNCTISNNTGVDGGGMNCLGSSSSPTIKNCTINGNKSNADGAGIVCDGSSPTITNCTIMDNIANDDGGGIVCWSSASPKIENCTINGNIAGGNGGGIKCKNASPTITNSIISNNSQE